MDDEDVRRFRGQVRLLQRRLRHETLPSGGLSRSAMQVLGTASRRGPVSPREIADELRMTSSNVAAALRELEEAACVRRERDDRDGRRVRVRLTDAGETVVADFRDARDSWLGRAMERRLTPDELRLLLRAGDLMARVAAYDEEDA